MTHAEKNIVETYSGLLERLSSTSKLELLEKLVKSIKREKKNTKSDFFKSFGAFESDKSAEELIADIKNARKFRDKDLKI